MRYGYINENGIMVARAVKPEEVETLASNGWKKVDEIEEERLTCEEGYIIKLRPYDAGDHIAFDYVKKFDIKKVRTEIASLKAALSASDYKVSKCYETSLMNDTPPYDIVSLHSERQAQRDRINALETVLDNFSNN